MTVLTHLKVHLHVFTHLKVHLNDCIHSPKWLSPLNSLISTISLLVAAVFQPILKIQKWSFGTCQHLSEMLVYFFPFFNRSILLFQQKYPLFSLCQWCNQHSAKAVHKPIHTFTTGSDLHLFLIFKVHNKYKYWWNFPCRSKTPPFVFVFNGVSQQVFSPCWHSSIFLME